MMALSPLIPAKAGIQMQDLVINPAFTTRRVVTPQTASHMIWAPAFAGVSGVGYV
jgi:hypothetical protein